MNDLKINGCFQELSKSDTEAIEGGWVLGRVMSGISGITNGAFNISAGGLEAIDRGIGTILNTPASIIRSVFRV